MVFSGNLRKVQKGIGMPAQVDFEPVFHQLRKILEPFEPHLLVKADTPGSYSLDAPYSEEYKKEMFFGAVQIKKRYVSFHLMPAYMFPELLEGISLELRARMQGKSCFNFRTLDPRQVKELARLAQRGFARFKRARLVK